MPSISLKMLSNFVFYEYIDINKLVETPLKNEIGNEDVVEDLKVYLSKKSTIVYAICCFNNFSTLFLMTDNGICSTISQQL